MFWAVKLTENGNPDKYGHNGYGIGVGVCSQFSWSNGSLFKNVVIFGIDNSSSAHVDKKKDKERYLSSSWRSNKRLRWYHNNSRS